MADIILVTVKSGATAAMAELIAAHYNRYCIRCHAVDGRGVWDIPDVPDFSNPRWQANRSDGRLARIILEGRGAIGGT